MSATGGARLQQSGDGIDDVQAGATSPGEDAVARYIESHPDLFQRRPALLEAIDLPDPHGGQAVSLGQRQAAILRERVRGLERELADLLQRGRENDAIDARVARWCARLLSERDEAALPALLVQELERVFDVPAAALRLWDLAPGFAALPCAAPAGADVIRFADSMHAPFCGPNSGFTAAAWLQSGSEAVRSLAMIALRGQGDDGAAERSFGLLVLGSHDAQRFRSDMGTEFLGRIGILASAALSRLRRQQDR